jgi:hypothetical protein
MTRDSAPLKRVLDEATERSQDDIYTLLATWNTSMANALEQSGDRFRDVFWEYLEETVELIDVATVEDEPDWMFLQECADAYPSAVGDHHCTVLVANVLGRCSIRTHVRHDVDAIPVWALDYLGRITMEDDKDAAWEESGAFGWGISHEEVAVADRTLARAEADDEYWASSVLKHAIFADAHAAINLYERILQSPDTIEDLQYVEGMQRILDHPFPQLPRYWEPTTELDYAGTLSTDETDHLLRVLGENVHPKRLQQFDDMIQFDLERAATEYGEDGSA